MLKLSSVTGFWVFFFFQLEAMILPGVEEMFSISQSCPTVFLYGMTFLIFM